ncbi:MULTISPECIES: hypothetical protein [unclassified Coleofasciculus]|nr:MULTISPECIES: hypothetical protein [unclassified Coleofasciculus]MBE9124588.1 hypothetical protein [Coleofasciculus sp. LEGE 07081]MBE9147551.1 hypothetical protein [Coleofasciculus sp. LEGE 07092]
MCSYESGFLGQSRLEKGSETPVFLWGQLVGNLAFECKGDDDNRGSGR